MKNLISCVILSSLLCGLHADYSCLTKQENARVTKAFEEAKFYHYYATMAVAKDTRRIESIKLISDDAVSSTTRHAIYEVHDVIVVEDIEFKRTFNLALTYEVQESRPPFFSGLFESAAKIGAGFIGGILTGAMMCRK